MSAPPGKSCRIAPADRTLAQSIRPHACARRLRLRVGASRRLRRARIVRYVPVPATTPRRSGPASFRTATSASNTHRARSRCSCGPSYLARASSLPDYSKWFGRSMALLGVCGVLLVARLRRTGAVIFLALSPLLIGSLAETRFDFWPAVLCTAAVIALFSDRHRIGWSLLGAAFAAKLYALVLVPLAIVLTVRRRGRRELARAAACGALTALVFYLPFLVLAPHGLWESTWQQASRPLEIESLAASYLLTFANPHVIGAEGALAISGHGALATATTVALLAVARGALGDLRRRRSRRRPFRPVRSRVRGGVHRIRQGHLAAVPDLARAARAARARASRPRRRRIARRGLSGH